MSVFNMSDYLETKILKLILENSSFTPPTTVYLALFTALSADGGSVTEISTISTGYARQTIAFTVPSASATANTALVDFPVATTNWGTINYYGIYDAATGGNLLYWGAVTNPTSVNVSEQFEVAAGALQVSIGGNTTDYLGNAILNHTLRNAALTPPALVYVALLTSYTNDSTYTECGDANYIRQTASFPVPSGTATTVANSADITYAAAASVYTVTYTGLFDASVGGNMLVRGPVSPNKTIAIGKVIKFPAGNFTITAD